jgi:hypothetical protein
MLALNTTTAVRYTPSWQIDPETGAPLPGASMFLVRPGSIIDRGQVDAELAGPPYNAARVLPWDFISAAEAGARHLLDGDDLGQVLDAWAALREAVFDMDRLPPDQKQLLIAIEPALCSWPEYGELRRREARREELLPALCAKRFLVGWEHGSAVFATGKDGLVTDAALFQLPDFERRAVGMYAYSLMQAEHHRPFSPPLSNAAPSPAPTRAAGKRRSAAKAGK